MGEQVYSVGGIHISFDPFDESDHDYGCLCTALSNSIGVETVRSFALLGAAVVLACQTEGEQWWYLPRCVPEEIQDAINDVVYAPLDDLDCIVEIVKKFYTPYPLDSARKKKILELIEGMHD